MLATADEARPPTLPGVTFRITQPDDPALLLGRAVADVSFGFADTGIGTPGPAERDTALARFAPHLVEHLRYRAHSGLTITMVAETEHEGVVATGSYQPLGNTAEILAVATMPSRRLPHHLLFILYSHSAYRAFGMRHRLVQPRKAHPGNRIAIISPSFAAVGAYPKVHEQAMRRLIEVTGLVPVEYPTTRTMRTGLVTVSKRDGLIGSACAMIGTWVASSTGRAFD